jgi:hypothetical protein
MNKLDFRGYEIVRVQFFNFAAVRSVTFSTKGIRFSAECIRNLGSAEFVKLWLHPVKKSLIIKPCSQEERQKIRWVTVKNGKCCSRAISAAAYIKTVYELFDWSPRYKYRFRGGVKDINGVKAVEFDLREPETITADSILFPEDWGSGFGMDYYSYAELRSCSEQAASISTNYFHNTEPDIKPTAPELLNLSISDIFGKINKPEADSNAESDS